MEVLEGREQLNSDQGDSYLRKVLEMLTHLCSQMATIRMLLQNIVVCTVFVHLQLVGDMGVLDLVKQSQFILYEHGMQALRYRERSNTQRQPLAHWST